MNSKLLVRQIQHSRRRDLLIDTNLLLLYFVGSFRPDLIQSFSRTSKYTPDDFALVETLLSKFRRFSTTPHVLTEVSNLMGQCSEPLSSDLRHYLAKTVQAWKETSTPSRILALTSHFPRFGLTDTAIADFKAGMCLVLTDDNSLAGLLQKKGADVIRFSDLQRMCL
jgi:hypothetical protein